MELAHGAECAVKIDGQWFDAVVVGRNRYGGTLYYTVETLDGRRHNLRWNEVTPVYEIKNPAR